MVLDPKELFETLLGLDWHDRFDPFNADEVRVLRLYDELASELGGRSFFAEPQRLTLGSHVEDSYERLEHAGEDSLRSMAITFRQLWMQGEPAQFQAVLTLLRRHARPATGHVDVVPILDELGRRFRKARRQELMKHVWIDDPAGEPIKVFRAAGVIDDWFYSGVFHSDAEKVEKVGDWSSVAYEWSVIKAMNAIAGVIWELQLVVRGALADTAAVRT